MRKLLPVTAVLLLITGIVAVNLWRELRAERQLTSELRSQLADARDSLRTSVPPPMATLPPPPPPPVVATPDKAAENKALAPAPRPATTAESNAATLNALLSSQSDLMKDPEYRKARRAQVRLSMPRSYPDLAEELGLSDQEADEIFDLLADDQIAMTEQFTQASANSQVDQAELTRVQQQRQRDLNDALLVKLGGARYGKWQEYQQTRPARTRVTAMELMLAQSGQALTPAQRRPLTAAMIAEQKSQQTDMAALLRDLGPTNTPEGQARVQEALQKRQQESNRRLLEAAAPHLNAEQLAALKAQFETQDAMSRASSRAMRERALQQGTP